jgi:hypothetical protein
VSDIHLCCFFVQCYERQMHTFVFILFNAYSRQINYECLTCARVPETRCTFMCLTCSVVLDTTHLIVFNVFSDSQLKIDGKYKNEISNIVEVKTNLLSNSQTLRQCYFHLLRKCRRGV